MMEHARRELSLRLILAILAVAGAALAAQNVSAEVVIYHAPKDEKLSKDYAVEVDGKPVDVYVAPVRTSGAGGPYSFASFDFSGTATVKVTSERSLSGAIARPRSYGLTPSVNGNTLSLTLNRPCQLSIEPDGKNRPLLLFANPIETDRPNEDGPGVRYFGPGIHRPGEIRLKSNETLYLAGGAIVKGAVIAEDAENIRILGRGILDGIDWEWRAGPAGSMIKLRRCSSVVISGITLRSSWGWTIVLAGCDHVKVSNVKICNGRVMNDDGINPVNSQHVTIEDCFIRSDDDCIAMKGMGYGKRNVEDIRVQNCVLWCDRARIFLLGHESRAEFMRNITVRDCDIIHYGFTPFLVEPGEEMTIEDILFEDIRVNCERPSEGPPRGPFGLIRLNPTINQYMKDKTPGRIRRLHFRDITVSGDGAESASIHLGGYDEQHMVENVTFENVTRNGEPVREDSPRITIDRKHVRNIRFISEGE
jgi:hypothetical protein